MDTAVEEAPILSSALTLQRRTLWLGRIHLYEDRLSITGWNWTGAVDRELPLEAVRLVEMWPVPRGVNLAIYPEEGPALYCRIAEEILFWVNRLREDDRTTLVVQPEHYPSFSAGLTAHPPLVAGPPAG